MLPNAYQTTARGLTSLFGDIERQLQPGAGKTVRGAVNGVARSFIAERWRLVRLLYPRGGFSFDEPVDYQISRCRILLTEARRVDGFGRGFIPFDECQCVALMAGELALRWLRRFDNHD